MKKNERRQAMAICELVSQRVAMVKETANKEVLQKSVAQMRALQLRGQFCQAVDLSYEILMEAEKLSNDSSEEADESHETSKTPQISVRSTVNIGRSIKFIRVAAEIRQGEMADRLEISQNYLSLLENNKADPSLSLLKKISATFNVPVNFLLLESSVDFESDNPEVHSVMQQLQKLIHQFEDTHIKESQEAIDGTDNTDG